MPSTSSEKSFTLDELIEAKKSFNLLISHLIPSIVFETALDKNPKMLVTTSELVIRLFTKVIISDKKPSIVNRPLPTMFNIGDKKPHKPFTMFTPILTVEKIPLTTLRILLKRSSLLIKFSVISSILADTIDNCLAVTGGKIS